MTTSVNLSGLVLDNPVIPASGTFGYGREFAELYDLNILGSFAFKGTTLHPRFGNAVPRIAEAPGGMLNSVGLQNPGIRQVISRQLPYIRSVFHKPVIANIGGFSVEEYVRCAELLEDEDCVGIIELNISCPNVHGGGMAFGTDPHSAEQVTQAVKKVSSKPVYVKLTPNVTDITQMARAVQAGGADGISLINTLLGMRIDPKRRKPVLANTMGGLSGPAVFPVALRMVYQVYEAVKLPIMGMGGVTCARDVIEMMLAGASAVQVGAANLVNPYACRDIILQLPQVMEEYGIKNLSDITGGAH